MISAADMEKIMGASATDLFECTAFHLLYDMALRVQDLLEFTFEQLLNGRPVWEMKKTK